MADATVPQVLARLGRPVFTTRDAAAMRGGSASGTTQVLRRMERDGLVTCAARGIWYVPSDPRLTAYALVEPLARGHRAYVSFLTALHLHGCIEQIPQVVHVATTGRSHRLTTPLASFSFHRIAPSYFDGFAWHGRGERFLLATPEKALADCFYVSAGRGRQFRHFPEIDADALDPTALQRWVEEIPDRRRRNYALRRLAALT